MCCVGEIDKLQCIQANPRFSLQAEFCKIWGVGPEKANKLIVAGYTSIDDLRARGLHELSRQQLLGLKYYDDLLVRIPRVEVKAIEDVVVAALSRVIHTATSKALDASGVECITCGSYRRGNSTCGDVDILIKVPSAYTHSSAQSPLQLLALLIHALKTDGFLVDDLSLPDFSSERQQHGSYMGICRLPDTEALFRHIDIKVYDDLEFPFALLYFTGSDIFNRYASLPCTRYCNYYCVCVDQCDCMQPRSLATLLVTLGCLTQLLRPKVDGMSRLEK